VKELKLNRIVAKEEVVEKVGERNAFKRNGRLGTGAEHWGGQMVLSEAGNDQIKEKLCWGWLGYKTS